jgi:hypothetical protein
MAQEAIKVFYGNRASIIERNQLYKWLVIYKATNCFGMLYVGIIINLLIRKNDEIFNLVDITQRVICRIIK